MTFAILFWYDLALRNYHIKFIAIWIVICIIPTFFVFILIFLQIWQIAINQTSNEMANYFRYDYFFPKPEETYDCNYEKMEYDDGLNGDDESFKYRKFQNPFDKGIVENFKEFFKNEKTKSWHLFYSISEKFDKSIEII